MAKDKMRVHAPGGSPGPSNATIGSESLLHYKLASGDGNVDLWSKNAPYKFRVGEAYVVMHGAGATGDKVKLQRGDGAASETFADITDDLDVSSAADKSINRFTTYDDAQWEIDKDESLRIVSTSGSLADVFIRVYPV